MRLLPRRGAGHTQNTCNMNTCTRRGAEHSPGGQELEVGFATRGFTAGAS